MQNFLTDEIKRGDVVSYRKEPGVPLKVISEPYIYNDLLVVTARKVSKKKGERQQGMYCVNALVPYSKQHEATKKIVEGLHNEESPHFRRQGGKGN